MIESKWSFTLSINDVHWLLIRIWIGDTHWTWMLRFPLAVVKGKVVS